MARASGIGHQTGPDATIFGKPSVMMTAHTHYQSPMNFVLPDSAWAQVKKLANPRNLLPAMGLDRVASDKLEVLVSRSQVMHAGTYLFRAHDPFTTLYIVSSGCYKSYTLDDGGREHVLGFHFPGEMFGFDAIHSMSHHCNAMALEASTVSCLPYNKLETLAGEIPGLRRQLLRLMSKDLAKAEILACDEPAEVRVAAFILHMAKRCGTRGFSGMAYTLPMSRRDIGNYLRLAPETVSRVLRRLRETDVVQVDQQDVTILDRPRLDAIAEDMTGFISNE